MKRIAAITMVVGTSSHAGFGGMGNVEDDGIGTGDLSGLAWGALILALIWLAWKKFF